MMMMMKSSFPILKGLGQTLQFVQHPHQFDTYNSQLSQDLISLLYLSRCGFQADTLLLQSQIHSTLNVEAFLNETDSSFKRK
jgi:hypothetical protein